MKETLTELNPEPAKNQASISSSHRGLGATLIRYGQNDETAYNSSYWCVVCVCSCSVCYVLFVNNQAITDDKDKLVLLITTA